LRDPGGGFETLELALLLRQPSRNLPHLGIVVQRHAVFTSRLGNQVFEPCVVLIDRLLQFLDSGCTQSGVSRPAPKQANPAIARNVVAASAMNGFAAFTGALGVAVWMVISSFISGDSSRRFAWRQAARRTRLLAPSGSPGDRESR